MIHRVLKISRWVVDFLFALKDYDREGVLACLNEINAPGGVLGRANEIMEERKLNRGFTYSNPELKRAVVVIGPTSSGEEFLNTFSHEIDHLTNDIADSLGIREEREGTSYLTGDTTMALAEVLCFLGCKHCRPGYDRAIWK